MKTLVLSSTDILKLLDYDELRAQMKEALKAISSEQVLNEPRYVVDLKNSNALGFMPAYGIVKKILGYKLVSVFPSNTMIGRNPHQGLVALLEDETGRVKALMDGSILTAIRTAAVSAVATDCLSRKDAKVLAIIGSGCQSREHIRALMKIRSFQKINIYTRKVEIFNDFHLEFSSQAEVQYHSSAKGALSDADVVVTCTSSSNAIVESDDFLPGTHVNAIGSCRPGYQEVNLKFNPQLKIFLDHGPSCYIEADEIFRPASGAPLALRVVGEVGEVLNGTKFGRQNEKEITFFKSVGLAAEDIFAAQLFYEKAKKFKLGTLVQF